MSDKRGTILLLAVMIMSTLLTVALGTSILVITLLNLSADIDNSITAFYSAEAGIEKSLYRIRKESWQPLYKEDVLAPDTDSQDMLTNDDLVGDFSIQAVNGKDSLSVDLVDNMEYQLNLYDPNLSLLESLTVDDIEISGVGNTNNDVKLHISWTTWRSGQSLPNPEAAIVDIAQNTNFTWTKDFGDFAYLRKIKIKSLGGDLSNVIIKVHDGVGTEIAIPGIYVITSVGEFPKDKSRFATQIINVEMPIIEPTYGIYNYVIFSESDISKSVSW